MTTYRAGQRVRIEWPGGNAAEGLLQPQRYSDALSVVIPRAGGESTLWQPTAQVNDGRVVTILSEPRPEEPTGLGAVVEAGVEGVEGRFLWIRARKEPAQWRPWSERDANVPSWGPFRSWSRLIDPVVLSEGWTP